MKKRRKLVFPGEFLTTAEEFTAGKNAFENEEGSISSTAVGLVSFNEQEREVSVEKKGRTAISLSKGDIVLGRVVLVKSEVVVLHLFEARSDNEPKVIKDSRVSLPISRVSRTYTENLGDEFKIGDIVKARVAEVKPYAVDVCTNEPGLGVIKAFCTHCRQPLHLFLKELKCLNCGRREHRKISRDYLLK